MKNIQYALETIDGMGIATITFDEPNSLVNTMIVNDDNLTRTSLAAVVGSYNNEQAIFAALNISSTSARAPYAVNLQNATVNVDFWGNIIKSEANSLASQAKGLPINLGKWASKCLQPKPSYRRHFQ